MIDTFSNKNLKKLLRKLDQTLSKIFFILNFQIIYLIDIFVRGL